MEEFAESGKAVGIVLDISLRHDVDKKRIIDEVKQSLIALVMTYFEDDVDTLYLYHPDVIDPVDKHGLQCYVINSYTTDGWSFNLTTALKQTLYTLALQDFDIRKYVLLITDRINNVQPIRTIENLNKKDMIDANIIIVGIGDVYNKEAIAELLTEICITYIHLDQASQLTLKLVKETQQ